MPKYIVLSAQDITSKLRYGSKTAAAAKAQHEVKLHRNGPFYVAEIISAIDAEVITKEVAIGEDSNEPE